MLTDNSGIPAFLSQNLRFRRLSEEQIDLIVENTRQKLYPKGQLIYEMGSDAGIFFILYEGKVQLSRLVGGAIEYQASLAPGDIFGEEALGVTPLRQTTAVAEEDTIVLEYDSDVIRFLQRDIPVLDDNLRRAQESFKLLWTAPIGWRQDKETIYLISRRHAFFLFMRMLPPAGFLLAGVLVAVIGFLLAPGVVTPLLIGGLLLSVAVLWGIWSYIDWTNDYYIITDRRVIYLEHIILLYDSRAEAPMDAILAVNNRTGLIGRWLGFGTVTVKSYTGIVRFEHITNPQEIQTLIQTMLLRAREQKTREDRSNIDQTISERLNPAPPAQPPPASSEPAEGAEEAEEEYHPGVLQSVLARLFHIRLEENGVITYRKHWFMLLLNIWLPSLILLGLFVLVVLRFFGYFNFLSVVGIVAIVLFLGFVVGLWWLYVYIDWRNDVYIVTSDEIIDVYKKPLGTETRKAAPVKNILSIEYRRLGFIGYLLNFGTVFIKVGETTFDFDYVYNPSEVQREVFQKLSEFKYREKQAQDLAEAQRMADWIEGYDRWRRFTSG